MSEWGYTIGELHFGEGRDFIAWLNDGRGVSDKGGIKRLRAFAFLQGLKIPDDDDELLHLLVKSAQEWNYLKFSVYDHASKQEWDKILRHTAKSVWENFGLISAELLNAKKDRLRSELAPSIEKRAEKHQFYLKWGFRRPW